MIKFTSFKKLLIEAPADEPAQEKKPDEQDMFAAEQPKPVHVKFDISRVKRYNPNKTFSQNIGHILRVTKQGMEVQADNHAVIFVNHEDIIEESMNRKSTILAEYSMPKAENPAVTQLVNFWNEYGPENLSQLDQKTIADLNKLDPTLARDVYSVSQALQRLQPFIDKYYQQFLGESHLTEGSDTSSIKFQEFDEAKPPKIKTDDKVEAKTIAKKFNIHDLEIKVGTQEEYLNSRSSAAQDQTWAKQLAYSLVCEEHNYWATKIEILTEHIDADIYENPYLNDTIKVTLSNGDVIKINGYAGSAPWNPSKIIKYLIIKVGSTVLLETNETNNFLSKTFAVYKTHKNNAKK